MSDLFGHTRTTVNDRYALITPDGFVPSTLPGWTNAVVIIHISPAMGGPRLSQLQITLEENGRGAGNTGSLEHFYYVVDGSCRAEVGGEQADLKTGGFTYVPPNTEYSFRNATPGTRLLVFQKKFEALPGVATPERIVGREQDVQGEPFLGNEDAQLQVLLPDKPEFDMAVNIFTYQPGATLPFVETHIMEHGLLMLKGQGVYRLDEDYHPVKADDVIWMAAYCPQWFVAMGKSPASYIYYKDVNRAPL